MLRPLLALLSAGASAAALTVTAEMTFDRAQLVLSERDGMTLVSLERLTTTWEAGAPALPVAVARLVVPRDMKVTAVTLVAAEAETLAGRFDVCPVQQPRAISDPGPFEFVPPDPKYYGSTYPGEVVAAGHQGSMSGYNIASVFVAPVRYDGKDKSLVFHPRVRFALELEPADTDCLVPGGRSPGARRRIEALVASVVLNPEDVTSCAPRPEPRP